MKELKIISVAELTKDYIPLPRPENPSPLTLLQIISVEPRIAEILIALKPNRGYWKRLGQYSETKKALGNLVGWGAEQYILRTCQAYDVILDIVIEKLSL